MARASTGRTRAELDRLVSDLPVEASPASTTVAVRSAPSYHTRPIGGLRVNGPWRMDRHVVVLSLIGGTRVEAGPQPGPGAPTVYVRAFSLVGGVRVRRSRDA